MVVLKFEFVKAVLCSGDWSAVGGIEIIHMYCGSM